MKVVDSNRSAVLQTTHETAQCNEQSLNYKLSKNTTRAIQVETCHSLIWNSLQALDASQVSLENWKLRRFHKAKINIDKDMNIHISQLINLYEGCMEWWRHGANLCTHQNCASFQTLVMSQFIIDESGGWGGWTKGSGHHQVLLQRDIDPCPPNYLRLRVRTSKTAQTHTRERCVFGLLREWHAGGAQ